jgi:putative ABC transport system substrate-binding protein
MNRRADSRATWRRAAHLGVVLLSIGLQSCQKSASTAVAPAVAAPAAGGRQVAVIRLSDPSRVAEPPNSDIRDGLKYSGWVVGQNLTLRVLDAKGNASAVGGLVDDALQGGANLLITLQPETTRLAAERTASANIPLVFQMTGDPFVIALGRAPKDHPAHLTGAYVPFGESLLTQIARVCLHKGQRLGILFNPDEPESVANKDALVRGDPENGPIELAEFRSDSEARAAADSLLGKKVAAILLVSGIGPSASEVIEKARLRRVPVFGFTAEQVHAGAVLARVPQVRWGGFEAGRRAGQVLSGQSPASIDLASGSQYKTVVNADVAKELGVTVPGALLRDALMVSKDARDRSAASKPVPPAAGLTRPRSP